MSYNIKKGKFVYQGDLGTPTHSQSPRKRKRSSKEIEEEEEEDLLFLEAINNYELTQESSHFPSTNQDCPSGPRDTPIFNNPLVTPPYNNPLVTPTNRVPHKESSDQNDEVIVLKGENTFLRNKISELEEKLKAQRHQNVFQTHRVEEEQRKETNSLKADLAFKNQEITILKEKCRNYESQSLEPTRRVQPQSFTEKKGFDATENFVFNTPKTTPTSNAVLPPNRKKRSHSNSHTHSSSHASIMTTTTSRGSQTEFNFKIPYWALSSHEINGAQLMRLLVQRNLLMVPDYKTLETQLENREEQETVKDLMEPLGLLSLVPVPTSFSPYIPTPPTFKRSKNFFITPVNRRCEIPKLHLPSQDTPLSFKRSISLESMEVDTPETCDALLMSTLRHSCASLLKSADIPSTSSFSNTIMPHFSFDTFGKTALKSLNTVSSDNGISLLASLESILDAYLQEQVLRRRRESTFDRPLSSIKGGRVTIDSSSNNSSGSSQSAPHTPISQTNALSSSSLSDRLSQDLGDEIGSRFYDSFQTPASIQQKKQALQVHVHKMCMYMCERSTHSHLNV